MVSHVTVWRFTVGLSKGSRGLGLSVTGGVDTEERWPGLIRVKRLFPHQPAWQSGQLAPGDFLLVANNISLIGLTNYVISYSLCVGSVTNMSRDSMFMFLCVEYFWIIRFQSTGLHIYTLIVSDTVRG